MRASKGTSLRAAVLAVVVCAAVATILPTARGAETPAGLRAQAEEVRARVSSLAARSHEALLSVYALENRLARAQARLSALQAQAADVRAEQALVRRRLGAARQTLALAERGLATRLRSLYETGESHHPLAVLLGAQTLDDAISGIEHLERLASLDRRVIRQASDARRTAERLSRRLRERASALRGLQRDAAASAQSLAAARGERVSLLAQLREQQRIDEAALESIEARAEAAAARSLALAAAALPPPAPAPSTGEQPAAAAEPAPAAAAAEPESASESSPAAETASGTTLTVTATGYAIHGTTATGLPTGWGVVAVDPSVIPLGTSMTIPGYGSGVAADVGSAVVGATIDLWFPTEAQALAWGRRTVTIQLH